MIKMQLIGRLSFKNKLAYLIPSSQSTNVNPLLLLGAAFPQSLQGKRVSVKGTLTFTNLNSPRLNVEAITV